MFSELKFFVPSLSTLGSYYLILQQDMEESK